jgi:addiction module RelE/StbE family toxin
MRVRYTRRALSDIASIAEYIQQHNPSAAQRVESAIRSCVEMLRDFPKIGRDRPELDARSLGVPRYPYTVYYRVRGKRVSILHIRHDRRKPLKSGDLER